MAIETTKIVRMQQRRGLKQDLPKPLRPGEIGFATDSRQLYIGADTSDDTAATFNKTCVFEKTASAQSITSSFADTQIIKFTVPNRWYDKGDFNGVTTTASWFPSSVFKSTDTYYKNIVTGNNFQPNEISVVKNGTALTFSNTASIGSSEDFFFNQTGNTISNSHVLTFRTPPSGGDEIGITYYSNADVIHAISNTTVAGVNGFYAAAGISSNSYRQLSDTNIRVTPDTGVGYIGLQYKHIQVATDVKESPIAIEPNSLSLGTLFISRNDQNDSNVALTANATHVVLSPVSDAYNVSTEYNHTYITSTSGWVNNKVIEVVDVSGDTITAVLPSNTASITRTVSDLSNVSGNLVITVSNKEWIEAGDTLYFLDPGNVTNLNGVESTAVTSISSTTNEVTVSGINGADVGANTANLSFIVYKNGVSSNVVITSTNHGIPSGESISLSNVSTFGVTSTVTSNTLSNSFVVSATGAVTSNISPLTFTPVVANTTVNATPVLSLDLSGYSNINDVSAYINTNDWWLTLDLIPNSTDKVFITHKEASTKDTLWAESGFGFALHNDSELTVSALGLTAGSYSRSDSTIKAKLEDWMYSLYGNPEINIFTGIFWNTDFSFSTSGTEWDLNIDSTLGEVSFSSRTEARDFSTILNNLYYEAVNPDVKGLLNIKTNIEFLTYEALAAGSASTTFEAPEVVTITNGSATVPDLYANAASGAVNTVFVEYSIKDTYSNNNQSYARVGTLQFIGDTNSGQVALIDTYSDVSNNTTGNIVFTGSMSGDTVTISANNTITPSNDMTMKFVRRRWSNTR